MAIHGTQTGCWESTCNFFNNDIGEAFCTGATTFSSWTTDIGAEIAATASKVGEWAQPHWESVQGFCQDNSTTVIVGACIAGAITLFLIIGAIVSACLNQPALPPSAAKPV